MSKNHEELKVHFYPVWYEQNRDDLYNAGYRWICIGADDGAIHMFHDEEQMKRFISSTGKEFMIYKIERSVAGDLCVLMLHDGSAESAKTTSRTKKRTRAADFAGAAC